MKNIMIVGTGEIGTSLKNIEEGVCNKVYTRDLEPSTWEHNDIDSYDICHVAIPFKSKEQFITSVQKHLWAFTAKVTIIHSTVEVGTTSELIKQTDNTNIVHSFIRGIHPHLEDGILTFEKYIGTDNDEVAELVADHYTSIGIIPGRFPNPETSELAKLLSTTYYGFNILFAKMVKNMCDDHGLSYNDVYTASNKTYNDGYHILGKKNVMRPVLFPPDKDVDNKRRILGHCVVPNFYLLPDGPLRDFCITEECR